MPVDNSRLKGFYKLDVEERRAMIAKLANLSDEQIELLQAMENWMMPLQIG